MYHSNAQMPQWVPVDAGMLKEAKTINLNASKFETTLKNLLFIFKIKPDFVSRDQKLNMSHSFKEIQPKYGSFQPVCAGKHTETNETNVIYNVHKYCPSKPYCN